MSDHSWNSSGSDEDQDPELGQPVEFGGVLSKASKQQLLGVSKHVKPYQFVMSQ